MSSNEVWATCIDCGAELEQSDKQCPKCGSTKKSYKREFHATIGIKVVETRATQKRKGYHRFLKKIISRSKPSGDPRFTEGVHEELIIDKEEKMKHHVVTDVKTGDVIHDEHEPLSKHKNQSKH
jgi:predicted amidophosphoribosyltransferase